MELAAELLEVRDEQELDRFLGNVFKKVKQFAGSATGKAVGGMLKGLLKKGLPIAGGAGGHVPRWTARRNDWKQAWLGGVRPVRGWSSRG